MKRVIFLIVIAAMTAMVAAIWAAEAVTQAPTPAAESWNDPDPKPTPAVDPAKRKFSRADRKLAREVIRDAAESMGLSRREFMRGVAAEQAEGYIGSTPHTEELETSLAMHEGAGFDIEEFGKFLEMILAFIEKIMALFGLFSLDAPTFDASVVAFILPDVPVVASTPFLYIAA